MIIVADSSPLISMAILEKTNLLEDLFDQIFIPNAVFEEITTLEKPYSDILYKFSKNRIKIVKNKIALSILSHELGLGESEAIILALENNIEYILIDENKGRRIAMSKSLHPIGTIGVLIQAKKQGLIKSIKPFLDKLILNNIFISNELYQYSLKLTKEI